MQKLKDRKKISNSDIRLQETIGEKVANWLAPSTMWTPLHLRHCRHRYLGSTDDHNQGSSWRYRYLSRPTTDRYLSAELELTPNESMYEDFCLSLTQTPIKLNIVLSKKTMPPVTFYHCVLMIFYRLTFHLPRLHM